MGQRTTFMDRDGVRINSEWIDVRGRRRAIADLHEVFIVENPPDRVTLNAAAGAAATAIAALVVVSVVTDVPMLLLALGVLVTAVTVAVAVTRLRPPALSLRANDGVHGEELLLDGDDTFVNQVGRALIRARECNHARNPAVYRVTGGAQRSGLTAIHGVTALVSLSALVLTAYSVYTVLG